MVPTSKKSGNRTIVPFTTTFSAVRSFRQQKNRFASQLIQITCFAFNNQVERTCMQIYVNYDVWGDLEKHQTGSVIICDLFIIRFISY